MQPNSSQNVKYIIIFKWGNWADLDLINGYKKITSSRVAPKKCDTDGTILNILVECDTKRT